MIPKSQGLIGGGFALETGKQNNGSGPPWRRTLLRYLMASVDLTVLSAAFLLSYLLRFDFAIPEKYLPDMVTQLAYVVPLQFLMLRLLGVHKFIWRYVGMVETKAFIWAGWWSFLPVVLLRIGLPEELQPLRVPLSVAMIDSVLAFGGVLAVRAGRRILYEGFERRTISTHNGHRPKTPVLLIGAEHAGLLATRGILGNSNLNLDIKGFVDDDPNKQGSVIQGIRVLGGIDDLPRLAAKFGIDHVVITTPRASRELIARIMKICHRIPIKARIIPGFDEILNGTIEVGHIRDVQVDDLLGRDPVHLNENHVSEFLTGRKIMVTGAGGSIGSELVRQIARFQPASLLLVERSEFALFCLEREMRSLWPELNVVPLLADVGDEKRMRGIFSDYGAEVVLHGAAHKHVPMMESNSGEAIKNNVVATYLLGYLAGEYGVDVFVLISSDKAVRPTSVMGASKRVAEIVVQDLNSLFSTRYVAVRFGNVMGSAGSVLPIFMEQILNGGPLTVTHPDMMRYFMTIPEAAQLVLQASTMGKGGEIFILEMGEPVRILDLARSMITLAGLKPFEDIQIVFTGIRPGEKLFEELGTKDELVTRTPHPKILIGKIMTYPPEIVRRALGRLAFLAYEGRDQQLRRYLNELLPEAQLDVADSDETPHEETLYLGGARNLGEEAIKAEPLLSRCD